MKKIEATKSKGTKMMNFSIPELDLKDNRSVQLYSFGKLMKFCVSRGAYIRMFQHRREKKEVKKGEKERKKRT